MGLADRAQVENEIDNEDEDHAENTQDEVMIKKSRVKEAEDVFNKAELKREGRKRGRIQDSKSEAAAISISADNAISALPPLPSGR